MVPRISRDGPYLSHKPKKQLQAKPTRAKDKYLYRCTGIKRICLLLLAFVAGVAIIMAFWALGARLWYELQGPLTVDSPAYIAIGRGIINGLVPYRDLFDNKPPGIYLITSASLWLVGNTSLATVAQTGVIGAVPLVLLAFTFVQRRHSSLFQQWTGYFFALTFGTTLALYIAERSGELQTESFGAFFGILFVSTIWLHEIWQKRWLLIIVCSLFLGFAIGIKEPFFLTTFAGALILCSDRPRNFLHTFVIPAFLTAVTGVSVLYALGWFEAYLYIDLADSFSSRIYFVGSPWMRALWWTPAFWDVIAFHRPFAIVILLFIFSSLAHAIPYGLMAFIRRCAAIVAALFLQSLAVGMGGEYYNHHYIFAAPVYAAFFLIFLKDTERGPLQKSLSRLFIALVAICLVVTSLFEPIYPYSVRLQGIRVASMPGILAAKQIDAILDACHQKRYFFFGVNGFHPYGYTVHSPYGPIFTQLDIFMDMRHQYFREKLLENLYSANLVVIFQYNVNTLLPTVEKYVSENFTDAPWPCARGVTSDPGSYRFLFRKPVPFSASR